MANAAQKNAAQSKLSTKRSSGSDPWDLPSEESLPQPSTEVGSKAASSADAGKSASSSKGKGVNTNMAKKNDNAKAKSTSREAGKEVDPMSTVNPKYRDKVVRVSETNAKGKATRVVIECQRQDCSNERDIATQDLFQVNFCSEHQRSGKKKAKTLKQVESEKAAAAAPAKTAKKTVAKKTAKKTVAAAAEDE